MADFTLRGRVHPASFQVDFEVTHTVAFLDENGAALGEFEAEIVASEISVRCKAPILSKDVVDTAYMRASELCQAMVDVAGMRRGLKLFAIIDRVEHEGATEGLVYGDQELGHLISSFAEEAVDEVVDLVLQDLPLRHAITDLMSMLWWPSYAPIACGRVIDSVRRMITPPEAPEGVAWAAMREALNLDEAYLRFVTNLSRGPRHGHRVEVSGTDNREMSVRAWTVLNRYIAFVRGGRKPLPTTNYPLLEG